MRWQTVAEEVTWEACGGIKTLWLYRRIKKNEKQASICSTLLGMGGKTSTKYETSNKYKVLFNHERIFYGVFLKVILHNRKF